MDKNFLSFLSHKADDKKQPADLPEFVGDMSPEMFETFLIGCLQKHGVIPAAGQKKGAYRADPDKRLGSQEKPGTGGRHGTKLSNHEKLKGAGVENILTAAGFDGIRTKDTDQSWKEMASQVTDDLEDTGKSPGQKAMSELFKRFGF